MILIIKTTERNIIELGLAGVETRMFSYETENQSSDILIKIDELLKANQKSLKDLTAIVVSQGPGSFTGVRVGITVANTLAWSLNIPVVGYFDGKVQKAIDSIVSENFSGIVLPYYPENAKYTL